MVTHTFINLKNIIDKHKKQLIDNKTNCYVKIVYVFKNNIISIKDCLLLTNYIFSHKDFVLDFCFDYSIKKFISKPSYTLNEENMKILNLRLFSYDMIEYNELKKYFIKHRYNLYVISINLKGFYWFNDKRLSIFLNKYIKLFKNIPFVFIYTYNTYLNNFISYNYMHKYNNFICITNYFHPNAYLFNDYEQTVYDFSFIVTNFRRYNNTNINKIFYCNKIKYEFIKCCIIII